MNLTATEHSHVANASAQNTSKGMYILLWVLQSLLGALFVFAGVMKFVMSVEEMTKQMAMPGWFLHFIGVVEVLGGLGLVLPGIFKIRRGLTPLAAAGLTIIMIGAVVVSAKGGIQQAIMPAVVGVLCAFVAYRRRNWS